MFPITHDNLPRAVQELLTDVAYIKAQYDELRNHLQPKQPTEYLTRTEVSELLKCDLSTVHNWTKKGKLKPYGIGNRVYYKRSELEAVLLPLHKIDNK